MGITLKLGTWGQGAHPLWGGGNTLRLHTNDPLGLAHVSVRGLNAWGPQPQLTAPNAFLISQICALLISVRRIKRL